MSKSVIKKVLIMITGNIYAQLFLEKGVAICQFLMGIGSGSSVESSGESMILNFIRHRFEPPYCIFDVGSNRGQYLHLILQSFEQNNIKVHCFEPSSYSFDILKNSYNRKVNDGIKLNKFALGKQGGELPLYFDKGGSELASLTKRKLDHFGIDLNNSEIVKIDTVDNYCQYNEINHIHLLKIDVEGHELDVLAGASGMLGKGAISIVSFEFGGCNIDTRSYFRDFYYLFRDLKMNIFRITPSGYLKQINCYKEIEEQFRTTNFMAMRGLC